MANCKMAGCVPQPDEEEMAADWGGKPAEEEAAEDSGGQPQNEDCFMRDTPFSIRCDQMVNDYEASICFTAPAYVMGSVLDFPLQLAILQALSFIQRTFPEGHDRMSLQS